MGLGLQFWVCGCCNLASLIPMCLDPSLLQMSYTKPSRAKWNALGYRLRVQTSELRSARSFLRRGYQHILWKPQSLRDLRVVVASVNFPISNPVKADPQSARPHLPTLPKVPLPRADFVVSICCLSVCSSQSGPRYGLPTLVIM